MSNYSKHETKHVQPMKDLQKCTKMDKNWLQPLRFFALEQNRTHLVPIYFLIFQKVKDTFEINYVIQDHLLSFKQNYH